MICKKCGINSESNNGICPVCGYNNVTATDIFNIKQDEILKSNENQSNVVAPTPQVAKVAPVQIAVPNQPEVKAPVKPVAPTPQVAKVEPVQIAVPNQPEVKAPVKQVVPTPQVAKVELVKAAVPNQPEVKAPVKPVAPTPQVAKVAPVQTAVPNQPEVKAPVKPVAPTPQVANVASVQTAVPTQPGVKALVKPVAPTPQVAKVVPEQIVLPTQPVVENKQSSKEILNNSQDENLLNIFIGKNIEKIKYNKFSFSAFFLNGFYAAYRKMWFLTIIWLIELYLFNMLNIWIGMPLLLITNIAFGLTFNKIYVSYANKKISNLKLKIKSDEELKLECARQGGTSIAYSLVYANVVSIVAIMILVMGMVTGLSDFFGGLINSDDDMDIIDMSM